MISLMLIAIMVDRPAFTLRNVALAATLILILQPESRLRKVTASDIINEVIAEVPVPLISQQASA